MWTVCLFLEKNCEGKFRTWRLSNWRRSLVLWNTSFLDLMQMSEEWGQVLPSCHWIVRRFVFVTAMWSRHWQRTFGFLDIVGSSGILVRRQARSCHSAFFHLGKRGWRFSSERGRGRLTFFLCQPLGMLYTTDVGSEIELLERYKRHVTQLCAFFRQIETIINTLILNLQMSMLLNLVSWVSLKVWCIYWSCLFLPLRMKTEL